MGGQQELADLKGAVERAEADKTAVDASLAEKEEAIKALENQVR